MYEVKVSGGEGTSFSVQAGNYSLTVDSQGLNFGPLDILLGALGSCVGVYLRRYCQGAKLDLKDFSITVKGELDKTPPAAFKTLDVAVDLKGLKLDERRQEALLHFVKNCPVHNTLKFNPAINIKVI